MNDHHEIGRKIFENIPRDKTPLWGLLLLSAFRNSALEEPEEISDLREIIKSNEWEKGQNLFSRIRELNLINKDKQIENYLVLAEKISKITYNQTETKAPFDSDSGFWIYELAIKLAKSIDSKNNLKRVEGLLNLFQLEKNKENFFALQAKSSGDNLLTNIFESNEPDVQILRNELPSNCQLNNTSLKNPISRLYKNNKNVPDGSFEFQFDLMFLETRIGYYSIIWSNEIEFLDEYFVLNKST